MHYLCFFVFYEKKNNVEVKNDESTMGNIGHLLEVKVISRNRVKECEMKPCFCQPIQFSLKLCWQNVGNF